MIGGFDLSLTATGMIAVPERWHLADGSPDWGKLVVGKAGRSCKKDAPEIERIERLILIEKAVVEFVDQLGIETAVLEEYAFSARASHAHSLGELGGTVKVALLRMGVKVVVVSPASARKLLGKQPKSDRKVWAAGRVYGAGAPKSWTLDQVDAFVVANAYLSESGGDAIVLPQQAAA